MVSPSPNCWKRIVSDYFKDRSTQYQGTLAIWVLLLVLTINSPVVIAENMLGVAMYELVSVPQSTEMQGTDDTTALG